MRLNTRYRKRILVNKYEILTHIALQEAAGKHNAKVYAKVRVADVLELDRKQLTSEQISYGMRAHFDFTVTRADDMPILAVEFDGDYHHQDVDAIRRDQLKNSICDKLEMPLLRINSSYLWRAGNYSILGWLIELSFMFEGYVEAEAQGKIPFDFDWWYGSFLPYRINEDGTWRKDPDPFNVGQVTIIQSFDKGIFVNQMVDFVADGLGFENTVTTYRFLELPTNGFIVGKSTCQFFHFPAISTGDASLEIASLDAVVNFQRYKKSEYKPVSPQQVSSLKREINRRREQRVKSRHDAE